VYIGHVCLCVRLCCVFTGLTLLTTATVLCLQVSFAYMGLFLSIHRSLLSMHMSFWSMYTSNLSMYTSLCVYIGLTLLTTVTALDLQVSFVYI